MRGKGLLAAVACCLVLLGGVAAGQQKPATEQPTMPDMPGMNHDQMPGMQHSHSAPDAQVNEYAHFSSGTGWQPIDAPENMWMGKRGAWELMLHANLFVTANHQGGPRGTSKLESMSMAMLMEQRKVGRGTLLLRQMFSGDALTVPHPGFPELFQTGETYHGRALVDHQHPHDVFSELSALYELPVAKRFSWFAYGGPAAEPALGPVAFVHRSSAAELPLAPLSHHLQDSTHISYGVVTSGVIVTPPGVGALKFEASAFNGREPDEHRATIDFGALDSWSFRAAAGPTPEWSLQYSVAHLAHPEALDPGDVDRQTASVAYSRQIASGHWCTTIVWGRNHKLLETTTQNSYLAESVVNFAQKNYLTTRLELVDKDELFPNGPPTGSGIRPGEAFRIGAFTFGGVRDVVHNMRWNIGIGANLTAYAKPAILDASYGKHPVSWELFVRIRPGQMGH